MLIKIEGAGTMWCSIMNENCLGVTCMQFRKHVDVATNINEFDRDRFEKEGYRQIEIRAGQFGPLVTMQKENGLGYCGLAGLPKV